ncbi:MAG: hypothetical protein MH825_16750 [Cyanobacteria bacterium]|nr:hypothetical protein [Cyanobacteriota bacterium]
MAAGSDEMEIEGILEPIAVGLGGWAIATATGDRYELQPVPPALQPGSDAGWGAGQRVRVRGRIREDMMTLAAIGPVFEATALEAP